MFYKVKYDFYGLGDYFSIFRALKLGRLFDHAVKIQI